MDRKKVLRKAKGCRMYLVDCLKNGNGTFRGRLVLSWVLASGLGLGGCAGDSSEGQEEEGSAEESDQEDNDSQTPEDSKEEDDSQDDEEDSGEDNDPEKGDSEGEEKDSGGDEESKDKDPDEEDPKEEDPDKDEDPDKEEDPGDGKEDGDKPKRDCEKIQWGSGSIKNGQIVPRDDQKGYLDKDGDGKLETDETEVGMCQLHLSGKRCGLVMTGFSG